MTTKPPIESDPDVMSSRPANIRSAVVLPQPEGPTRTMNSPSATCSERSVDGANVVTEDLGDAVEGDLCHQRCSLMVVNARSSVDAHGEALHEVALEAEVDEHRRKALMIELAIEFGDRRRSSGREDRESDGDRSIRRVLDEEQTD